MLGGWVFEMNEANEPDGREVDFYRCPRTDKTCTNVGTREECAFEDETLFVKIIQISFCPYRVTHVSGIAG